MQLLDTTVDKGLYVSQVLDMELGKVRDAVEEKATAETSFEVAHNGLGPVDSEGFVVDLLARKEELVSLAVWARPENTASATDRQGLLREIMRCEGVRVKLQSHLRASKNVAVDVETHLCRDQVEERRL